MGNVEAKISWGILKGSEQFRKFIALLVFVAYDPCPPAELQLLS